MNNLTQLRQSERQKKVNLSEWRMKRNAGEAITLPSGLDVRVRNVALTDLAATGNIPAPLFAMVDKAQDDKKIAAEDFKQFGELMDILAKACLIDPKHVDQPDIDSEHEINVAELSFDDKMTIFNWANREAVQVEKFRTEQGEPVDAVQPG